MRQIRFFDNGYRQVTIEATHILPTTLFFRINEGDKITTFFRSVRWFQRVLETYRNFIETQSVRQASIANTRN